MRRAGLLLVVVLLTAAALGSRARAFRTTRDETAYSFLTNPVAWPSRAPTLTLHEGGSDDLNEADALNAIRTAFATWTQPACTNVAPSIAGTTTATLADGDGESVVAWRESDWAGLGYSPAEIAVTHMEYAQRTSTEWDLAGGDIALNGENYTWVLEGGMPSSEFVDVQSILTHEGGHFLGLMHACEIDGTHGAPICPALVPATAPTMWPGYFGQLERTLERDDVDGICFLYPGPTVADGGVPADASTDDAGPAPPDSSASSCGLTHERGGLPARTFFVALIYMGFFLSRRRSTHARH